MASDRTVRNIRMRSIMELSCKAAASMIDELMSGDQSGGAAARHGTAAQPVASD